MVQFIGQAALSGNTRLTREMIRAVADMTSHEPEKLAAIVDVEARKEGFFDDGRPTILFEAHIFGRLTEHAFTKSHPNLSSRRWNRSLYLGGPAEYGRLVDAMELDEEAALQSASWGAAQIMGFNHAAAGYSSVYAMIDAFVDGPQSHIEAMCAFIEAKRIKRAVDLADWTTFARRYNGRGFAKNNYHFKLAIAWAAASGLTGLEWGGNGQLVLNLQSTLKVEGRNPGPIDGAMGPMTATALLDYQRLASAPFPAFLEAA